MEKVYKGGLNVYTTINYNIQKSATKSVKTGLRLLDKRQGYRGPIEHKSRTEIKEWLEGSRGHYHRQISFPGIYWKE